MKEMPQRTCMGCNSKKSKKDLIRIVKNKQNEVNVDKIGKQDGRGAYICNNMDCYKKVKKTRRLEKVLKIKLKDEVYDNLENFINGGEFIG